MLLTNNKMAPTSELYRYEYAIFLFWYQHTDHSQQSQIIGATYKDSCLLVTPQFKTGLLEDIELFDDERTVNVA